MKRREYRIGPGAASLLLVVVVVSMSVLGLLALINARGDQKLTERGAQFAASEYAASAKAESRLVQLDSVLVQCAQRATDNEAYMQFILEELPEEMEMEENIVYWQQKSEFGRTLMCAVEIHPLGKASRYAWREHMFVADSEEIFD